MLKRILVFFIILFISFSCSSDSESLMDTPVDMLCVSNQQIDTSRGACNEELTFVPSYSETTTATQRIITSNSIPSHKVGKFGGGQGSLNPNAISPQNETYTITLNPELTGNEIPLLGDGPEYSFGVLFNGVEVDPIAAEPFPHKGAMDPNLNWEWNLEAMNVRIGLDCNNAHVQPSGKYHYHSSPTLYLEELNISSNSMTHVGYAADGFPIYYKYAYSDSDDNTSAVIEMTSSYQLKTGNRHGDGIKAPCDVYNGVYSNDYEYIENLGTLDDANGRYGVTPEYPAGSYYYVITTDFPSIPRYFKGTPSNDFKIGR